MDKKLFNSLMIVTLVSGSASVTLMAKVITQNKSTDKLVQYSNDYTLDCPASYPCPRPNSPISEAPTTMDSEDQNADQTEPFTLPGEAAAASYPMPTPNQRLE